MDLTIRLFVKLSSDRLTPQYFLGASMTLRLFKADNNVVWGLNTQAELAQLAGLA